MLFVDEGSISNTNAPLDSSHIDPSVASSHSNDLQSDG